MKKQVALASEVSYSGVGLHSGKAVVMTLKPAAPDTGIVFVRTDLAGRPEIHARAELVTSTLRATTISENNATTTMTIAATGGKCTLEADQDDPHKCWGIKVDGDLTINAGTITVTKNGATTKKGIKVSGVYKKNGGTVTATIDND